MGASLWIKARGLVVLILAFLGLAGCNTQSVLSCRWVDGADFYSADFPALRVKVTDGYTVVNRITKNEVMTANTSVYATSGSHQLSSFLYYNQANDSEIVIKTVHLSGELFFGVPSLDRVAKLIEQGEKVINQERYYSGVYVADHLSPPRLVWQQSSLSGQNDLFQIYYAEPVSLELADQNLGSFTDQQVGEIRAFMTRAEAAFEILSYDGEADPRERQDVDGLGARPFPDFGDRPAIYSKALVN